LLLFKSLAAGPVSAPDRAMDRDNTRSIPVFMRFMGSLFMFSCGFLLVLLVGTTNANTVTHHPSKSSVERQKSHFFNTPKNYFCNRQNDPKICFQCLPGQWKHVMAKTSESVALSVNARGGFNLGSSDLQHEEYAG
jgi:hypothetical protein